MTCQAHSAARISRTMRAAVAVATGSLLALAAAPAASAATVYAGPLAASSNYLTPRASIRAGERLSFTNYDTVLHDVTARQSYRPPKKKKKKKKRGRTEPLFQSALIGFGRTAPVRGVERTKAGQTYAFFCSIHSSMTGSLTVR